MIGFKQFFVLGLLFSLHSTAISAPLSSVISGENLINSKPVHVSAESKKGLVVLFLSATCPCSNSHIEEILSLAKDHPEFSFVAIHSNVNEEEAFSRTYFTSKKIPFPVIQDRNSELANRFKALKTPHAFILNSSGEILYQGGVSNSANYSRATKKYLREALEDLKENHAVRTANGRTLGCVIQRS